jgi:hypothetical protein
LAFAQRLFDATQIADEVVIVPAKPASAQTA